jgi:hypothetical protein
VQSEVFDRAPLHTRAENPMIILALILSFSSVLVLSPQSFVFSL